VALNVNSWNSSHSLHSRRFESARQQRPASQLERELTSSDQYGLLNKLFLFWIELTISYSIPACTRRTCLSVSFSIENSTWGGLG